MCHVDEILKVIDDEQRASNFRDDRPPDLGGMSLAEVGLALKSHLLAQIVLRIAASSQTFVPGKLSFCPTAAEISLSLEAGRAQLGQAEGAEAALDEYIQEAGLEAWTFLVTWALNFVYSGRHGERAERPETSWDSEMDTKQLQPNIKLVFLSFLSVYFSEETSPPFSQQNL